MDGKKAIESFTIMNELVLPNDTNTFGNLMGGRLMYWMDIAAGIAASKHCNAPNMTASVDNLSFKNPIKLGNVVHIEAKVSRAFNTSMEIFLKAIRQAICVISIASLQLIIQNMNCTIMIRSMIGRTLLN